MKLSIIFDHKFHTIVFLLIHLCLKDTCLLNLGYLLQKPQIRKGTNFHFFIAYQKVKTNTLADSFHKISKTESFIKDIAHWCHL